MSMPSKEQISIKALFNHPWTLRFKALIVIAPGKEKGKNTKTEVTTRAWHEEATEPEMLFIIQ